MRRALALLSPAVLACALNPVTGRPELMLISTEREAALGREASKQVAQEMGLVEDPALLAYVREVGSRVAARSPRRDVSYQFFVAGMAEPNAFALPGGYVYVSRGLLALARSEDELANVMAHEVGHVAARHAAERETRAVGVGALSVLGAIAAGVIGGGPAAESAMQLGQVAGAGLIASYGRDQERQADEVGQKMAAAAGFDPGGMTSFLAALDRETNLRLGKRRMPTFLDSHPATPERVTATGVLARSLGSGGELAPVAARNAFVSHLAGLLVGEDPAEGVVRDNTFLHPDLDLRVRFPPGWGVQNGRTVVTSQAPEGAALIVLQGQERSGNPQRAAEHFLGANPKSVDPVGRSAFTGARVPGYRVRARVALGQGVAAGEFFWLAVNGNVYRLGCLAGPKQFATFLPAFLHTAASVGPLDAEERASIREQRLEIATAEAGESLEGIARRSGNVWSQDALALANGLEPGARLEAGQRIKLVVEGPYGSH